MLPIHKCKASVWVILIAAVVSVLGLAGEGSCSPPAETPAAIKAQEKAWKAHLDSRREAFEKAKGDAEVVVEVRVLTTLCTKAHRTDGKLTLGTIQIAMQVLSVEKGAVKKHEIVVVSRDVDTPQIITPKGYIPAPPKQIDVLNGKPIYPGLGANRDFPLAPGVKGNVALRWNKETRLYAGVAGWVTEPNEEGVPVEERKSLSVKDSP
jgi:hypothetical protein